ncbi:TPA: hypothetical protein ACJJDY_002124, partial [Neisseria meningitidis]
RTIFTDGSRADYIGFGAMFQHNIADEQKRERFSKVLKHRVNRFRTIRTVCGSPPCPDFC